MYFNRLILVCSLSVIFWALLSPESHAQDLSQMSLEPVSGLLFFEFDELNAALSKAGFDALRTPLSFVGSRSSGRLGEWLVGASIAQGATSSGGERRNAQLGLQFITMFLISNFGLTETFPGLRAFLNPGILFGQMQLTLRQRPVTETSFDDLLQTPHDTNLQRNFVAGLPRAGIEFKLGKTVTLRGSIGYLFSFWSSAWGHVLETIDGPPKIFRGIIFEFTIDYKLGG